jgi:hypothetical protein
MSSSDAPEAAAALIHLGKHAGLPTELREDAIADLALRESPTISPLALGSDSLAACDHRSRRTK